MECRLVQTDKMALRLGLNWATREFEEQPRVLEVQKTGCIKFEPLSQISARAEQLAKKLKLSLRLVFSQQLSRLALRLLEQPLLLRLV